MFFLVLFLVLVFLLIAADFLDGLRQRASRAIP
jgi:hypothetical protein